MNSLKSLAAITVGAIVLSVAFALSTKDRTTRIDVDSSTERSLQHTESGDEGEFVLKDEGVTLKAKWRGAFKLNVAGTDIDTLDRYLEILIKQDGVEQRAVFKRDDDEIHRRYFVDDKKQPTGDETDEEIAQLVTHFLRASGMNAEERVETLKEAGGVAAVLTEIDVLEGDHAIRRYVTALAEHADLSESEIARLATQIERIESDHDLSRSLYALLRQDAITPDLAPKLLNVANQIESSHDLRKVVEAFADRPLDEEAVDLAIGVFRRIDSNHDLRQAALALLESDMLDADSSARILTAATEEIEGDHDLKTLLSMTAPDFATSDAFKGAWLDGLREISSDHDRRISIVEVAENGDISNTEDWRALILEASGIDSSHDQRVALTAIADAFETDPILVEAYREAATKIDSEFDRKRALAALGDHDEE